MKIYLISDDNVVSRKLKENIEKRSLNKHETIIIKDCLNIDLKNCIGIIIDIIKISSIELEKFFIAFGSIPIAYFIEESNKKYLNKNSIRIYKEKINDLVVDRLIEYFERYSNLLLQYIFLKDKNSYVRVFYDKIIYAFLTIFLYLLKCPQSLILSALRAFCFCGKPHISRSIFLYFRYQTWLKSW